jgi:hypothetical protein
VRLVICSTVATKKWLDKTGCGDDISQFLGETEWDCDINQFVTVMRAASHSVMLLTVTHGRSALRAVRFR